MQGKQQPESCSNKAPLKHTVHAYFGKPDTKQTIVLRNNRKAILPPSNEQQTGKYPRYRWWQMRTIQ